jgi:hypothetical protein
VDFLTALAYWVILALVIVNAVVVLRQTITIDEGDDE